MIHPLRVALLALAIAGPAAANSILPRTPDPATVAGPTRTAFEAIAAGRLDEAEGRFNALRTANPTAAAPWLGLAEIAARRGNVEETERLLREGIGVAPQSPELHRALGRLLAAKGDEEGTVGAFAAAQRARPADPLSYLELGDILLERFGRAERSIAAYAQAQNRDPNDWRAPYGRGLALARLRQPAQALPPLAEAARLAPENPLPDYTRAQILLRLNRPQDALAAFDASLARAPDYAPSRLGKAALLMGQGRPRDAIPEFQRVLAATPTEVNALVGMGMARQATGDAAGAEAAFRAAIEQAPQHPVALNNLAWLTVERRGNLDDAARWAEAALTVLPNDPSVLTTLGWVRRARNELPQAEAALARAVQLQPNADRLARLGTVRAAMGKREEAIADLRRAAQMDASNAMARQELQRLGVR
jgi:tetratricopeptide (TPR) repeat protein